MITTIPTLGTLLVMSGPSGVGKSTVFNRVRELYSGLRFSVSCTTRAPRTGEIDGIHYYFLSREEYDRRVAAGEFLEHAEVHGNGYGTLRSEVEKYVLAGVDVMLDIDVQGQRLIRQAVSGSRLEAAALYVFLGPPSFAELERRLRTRGTDADEVIAKRLRNAGGEMAAWQEYDYLVISDEVESSASRLTAILNAARCRTRVVAEPQQVFKSEGTRH
jgi:guanylate kinase